MRFTGKEKEEKTIQQAQTQAGIMQPAKANAAEQQVASPAGRTTYQPNTRGPANPQSANVPVQVQTTPAQAGAAGERPTWGGGYSQQIDDLYAQITGRQPFNYNINEDAMWQSLKDDYKRLGQSAMRDTMGRAAGLTGGYGSSYGQAAGQAAYDQYLTQLSEQAPEFYDRAYQRYKDEGEDQYRRLSTLINRDQTEYDRYNDRYDRWLQERAYGDSRADLAYDRQRHEQEYADQRGDVEYQRQMQERAYSDSRADLAYDRQRHEQEYADQRGDVEYQRQMQERAYGDSRADLAYDRWLQERAYGDSRADLAYNQQRSEQEYADQRGDVEYQRQMQERAYGDSRADLAYDRALQERAYGDSRADLAYDRQRQERSFVTSLIQYGYTPTDEDLAAAGMTREEAEQMAAIWQAENPEMAYRMGFISAEDYFGMTGEYPAGYTLPEIVDNGSGGSGYGSGSEGNSQGGGGSPGYGNGAPESQMKPMLQAIEQARSPEEAKKLYDQITDQTFSMMNEEQVARLDKALRKAGM